MDYSLPGSSVNVISQADLLHPGLEHVSPALQADSLPLREAKFILPASPLLSGNNKFIFYLGNSVSVL